MRTYASGSKPSSECYAAMVTRLRRESLARRKSARLICANGYSSWLTARSEDAESCGNHPGARDSLTGAARNWTTPTANDVNSRGMDYAQGGTPLPAQAKRWITPHGMSSKDRTGKTGAGGEFAKQACNWPTPEAHNASNSGRGKNFMRSDGHTKPHDLVSVAKQWPTPTTITGGAVARSGKKKRGSGGGDFQSAVLNFFPPAPQTSTRGARCSAEIPLLNPRFVECLMGLPPGWTDSAPLETASFRLWRDTHSRALRALLARG